MKKITIGMHFNKIVSAFLCIAILMLVSFKPFKYKQENLLGFYFDYEKSEVTIMVASNGCTGKSDFKFEVRTNKITILRKKDDNCKMVPHSKSFTYSLKDAGIDANKKYILTNKIIANLNIATIP